MTTRYSKLTSFILSAAFSISSLIAAPYEAGSIVQAFTAKDQHDELFTLIPAETKFLLVTHDMATGKQANAVLNHLGKNYLSSKKAIYMANIHGMPSIGRFFALPKMRKYVHQIILGDDESLIARFPEDKGKVTVLTLQQGKVSSIRYWSPETEKLDEILR